MKATVYHGAHDVRLENFPDPSVQDPRDTIVRVTHAANCGSDLWFYRGVTELKLGDRTGHEFVGISGYRLKLIAGGPVYSAPVDVERAGYSSAILAATEPAQGFLLYAYGRLQILVRA